MGKFVYVPQDPLNTNIMRFSMTNGISERTELYNRADSDPDWFWPAVIEDTGIEFFDSYIKLSDSSSGLPWTRWFTEGKINIAYNCVERFSESEKIAIRYSDEAGITGEMTYAELDRLTGALAGSLLRIGIKTGDRVGIYMPPVPEAVIALYSIMRIGAIAVPFFSGYGTNSIKTRVEDSGIKFLFTSTAYKRRGKEVDMLSNVSELQVRLIVSGENVPPGMISFSDLVDNGMYTPCEKTQSEDPAIMLYTSGTTGAPKGTVHTHGSTMVNIAKEVKYYMDCRSDDTIFWISDLGWMMGPWYILGGHCLFATVFLYNGVLDYPSTDNFWDTIERNGVTLLGLSPTFVRSLKGSCKGRKLNGVRLFGSTGEPWDEESWLWLFRELGGSTVPISNISGGTDIFGCFLATTPAHPLMPRALFKGLGMKATVLNEKGEQVYDEVGYLASTGHVPSMTRGIWKNPEKYISTYWMKFPGCWVQGDWATMDREGYFFLLGRTDDVIKIAGKRLGPGEVENEVLGLQGVNEVAAIGVEDEMKGEALVIFYTGKNTEDTVNGIRENILRSVGKSFAPRHIIWVPSIPKTRNGKILRRVVKLAFLNRDVGDVTNLESADPLEYIKEVGKAYGY